MSKEQRFPSCQATIDHLRSLGAVAGVQSMVHGGQSMALATQSMAHHPTLATQSMVHGQRHSLAAQSMAYDQQSMALDYQRRQSQAAHSMAYGQQSMVQGGASMAAAAPCASGVHHVVQATDL